jgi:hypothetical protein
VIVAWLLERLMDLSYFVSGLNVPWSADVYQWAGGQLYIRWIKIEGDVCARKGHVQIANYCRRCHRVFT